MTVIWSKMPYSAFLSVTVLHHSFSLDVCWLPHPSTSPVNLTQVQVLRKNVQTFIFYINCCDVCLVNNVIIERNSLYIDSRMSMVLWIMCLSCCWALLGLLKLFWMQCLMPRSKQCVLTLFLHIYMTEQFYCLVPCSSRHPQTHQRLLTEWYDSQATGNKLLKVPFMK